jgi:multidrug efflux pump subunit AcrB
MWIVELALRRPYTFVVVSILIAMLGAIAALRMAVDIFPNINIPVISVIWSYNGLSAAEMEARIMTVSERAMTTVTSDIEHMEGTAIQGIAVIKVFLHQNANLGEDVALMSAINQTLLIVAPPGTTPPLITSFSASDVPVLQLGVSSNTLTEAQLYDYGLNFIRTRLATVGGAQVPLPYGGKQREVMVDLYPNRMLSKAISPADVVTAMNQQNVILPAGLVKLGTRSYPVKLNSSPDRLEDMNLFPIKQINSSTIMLRDIGFAHDGYSIQRNIVRINGHRATLMNILRSGGASTLAVVKSIKDTLPLLKASLPSSLHIETVSDQSLFVRGAIDQVIHEAVVAALLTGLFMFAILGSWRSTLIVATSIPLAILCSVIILAALGQTLNTMTLGGLALAVGMLVDDATVEVENIHRNLAEHMELRRAVLTSAAQIAVPAFVSTFAICIVFVPVTLLPEPERSLFVPLGMAVVFAMAASYFLSRTLVPVMAVYLLRAEESVQPEGHSSHGEPPAPTDQPGPEVRQPEKDQPGPGTGSRFAQIGAFLVGTHRFVDRHFNGWRERYHLMLNRSLQRRRLAVIVFVAFFLISLLILPFVGMDFFPQVDAGQMRLHVIAPIGSRVEETEMICSQIDAETRKIIPAQELQGVTENVGIPSSGINLSYGDNTNYTEFDAEMLFTLTPGHHTSTFEYQRQIRQMLINKFPNISFFFQSADITSQILNAGLPAPIDIQITGRGHTEENYKMALEIRKAVSLVPGAVDVVVRQVPNQPQINIDVDRIRAVQLGLAQRDVASSLLTSLSSSFQTSPGFWVNPHNGVNYNVAVQTPPYRFGTIDDITRTLITGTNGVLTSTTQNGQTTTGLGTYYPTSASSGIPSLLMNLGFTYRAVAPGIISHYSIQPVFDIYASVQDRDLGGVMRDVNRIIERFRKKLPAGESLYVRGQAQSMNIAFSGLLEGLAFGLVLIYLLLVVNFQSWIDPLLILGALPGAFAGIVWALFITQTTFSVPALMGAIMSIGVASANSILMVTFANDKVAEGADVVQAASDAGFTRFRPVLMTAAAMIIGMLPMSLGLGEGGAQNAPLARAVIGGLLVATTFTLIFVPVVYSIVKQRMHAEEAVRRRQIRDKTEKAAERDARRFREQHRGVPDEDEGNQ